MEIDTHSGLLRGARFIASPNCDARPADARIEVLIVHAISLPPGEFGGSAIERLFCNTLEAQEHPYYEEICRLRVSAHVLIRRDGQLTQFVPFHMRAWHAGESLCEGREHVNDFSVGVELEGCDDLPFDSAQYETLTALTRLFMRTYPALTRQRIYGHCDIAPQRKTDPGPYFDWDRYLSKL